MLVRDFQLLTRKTVSAPGSSKKVNVVASIGLAVGGVFGMAGTFIPSENLRNFAWAIDGLALIAATTLLALKFFRKGNDTIAAGFLIFAIGESVMLSGMGAGLAGSAPAFAAGTSLWATALVLILYPRDFPFWVRLVGWLAALLFFTAAAEIYSGQPLTPLSSPLPGLGYPFLVATFAGWIYTLLREKQ
jgi:hypothetical protein